MNFFKYMSLRTHARDQQILYTHTYTRAHTQIIQNFCL